MARYAVRSGLYLTYLLAAVLSIIYLFAYRPFVSALAGRGVLYRQPDHVRYVSSDTYLRLGTVYARSNNHFTHFEQSKRPGVFRICALGDSITAGAEVGPDHNYTAYLQRQLEHMGARNVEVINFGNSWYGFSQVAVMWHEVARNFDCDLLLLMVFGFWWERDTTFNHTNFAEPYYLHARHVITGDGLRLIEVAGKTFEERFDRYFAFLPPWRYLRYDRHVPAAIQALLPRGLRLPNPLYYQADPWAEATRIYRRLMSCIADSAVPMIVMSRQGDGALAALMQDEYDNATFAVRTSEGNQLGSFPYWAPIWHESAWGNEIMARRFVRALFPQPPPPVPVLKFKDLPAGEDWQQPPPLNRSSSLTVNIPTGSIGVLVSVHDRETEREHRHSHTLSDTRTVGLLAFRGPGETTLDACLLPLNRPLSPGAHVQVTTAGRQHIDLGPVRIVAPGIALWVLERNGITCGLHGPLSIPIDDATGVGQADLVAGPNSFRARLQAGSLIAGETGQQMFRFRGLGQFLADAESLPDRGSVTLVAKGIGQDEGIEVSRWVLLRDYVDVRVLRSAGIEMRIRSGRAEFVQ